jgi:hypothetical protein
MPDEDPSRPDDATAESDVQELLNQIRQLDEADAVEAAQHGQTPMPLDQAATPPEPEARLEGDFLSVEEVLAEVFELKAAWVADAAQDAPLRQTPDAEAGPPSLIATTSRADPSPTVPATKPPRDWLAALLAALRLAARTLLPLLVRALASLNHPLRLLPPKVRPLVDWVAISLVFWVPVVWAIALLAG